MAHSKAVRSMADTGEFHSYMLTELCHAACEGSIAARFALRTPLVVVGQRWTVNYFVLSPRVSEGLYEPFDSTHIDTAIGSSITGAAANP